MRSLQFSSFFAGLSSERKSEMFMPVTKTAKRALRGSFKKGIVNKLITSRLEIAVRTAKKSKTLEKIKEAVSLADRAAKKNVIHKNKAARVKSQLARLLQKSAVKAPKKTKTSKTSKKK